MWGPWNHTVGYLLWHIFQLSFSLYYICFYHSRNTQKNAEHYIIHLYHRNWPTPSVFWFALLSNLSLPRDPPNTPQKIVKVFFTYGFVWKWLAPSMVLFIGKMLMKQWICLWGHARERPRWVREEFAWGFFSHMYTIIFKSVKWIHKLSQLAGGFKHEFYFPFHIWDVILPIDELIFFRGVGIPPTKQQFKSHIFFPTYQWWSVWNGCIVCCVFFLSNHRAVFHGEKVIFQGQLVYLLGGIK